MNPGFAADERGVWVIDPTAVLSRIDPQTNQMVSRLDITSGDGKELAASSLWLALPKNNSVARTTPACFLGEEGHEGGRGEHPSCVLFFCSGTRCSALDV